MKTRLLVAAALAFLPACIPAQPPAAASATAANLVVRTYEVPNDGAAQVRAILRQLFWVADGQSGHTIGHAEVGPDGRLVVLATEAMQDGVKSLVDSIGKASAHSSPAMELTYWFVRATPGKGAPPPATLQEVAPALAEMERVDGPQQFTLEEKLVVTSSSGEEARTEGRTSSIRQLASAGVNGISAELDLRVNAQKVTTRVNLKPGQLALLASTGASQHDKDDTSPSTLLFLVRATTHDGQGR